MTTLAAAFPGRQLARSTRVRSPLISCRTFVSNPYLRNKTPSTGENASGSEKSDTPSYSAESMTRRKVLAETNKPKVSRREAAPKRGSLGSSSIFADEEDVPKLTTSGRVPTRRPKGEEAEVDQDGSESTSITDRDRVNMDRALNPHPNRRARWQRKMVIRSVRRRGRLTKQEEILRTERESLTKSHWFKTSVKKLGPLARQIAGKNIDDAILQMRFSKKKAAIDVRAHLEQAKNEAIVARGMGLGSAQANTEVAEGEEGTETPKSKPQKPTVVTLKDGKRKTIADASSIYISQAWVNRGPYGMDLDHRARGVINKLRPPYTGLSVVLKEEKTRIREWQDREAKALRQRKSKLWVHLPDRKITAQRQYYSW